MKKMIFTLAIVSGFGTHAIHADNIDSTDSVTTITQIAEKFTPIELKDLPKVVQESLIDKFPEAIVKAAAVSTNEDTKISTYKITLEDAEGRETTVLLSDKGDILQ